MRVRTGLAYLATGMAALVSLSPVYAQNGAARRTARPSTGVATSGCPAPVPPSTSNSVAAGSDWIEVERTSCAAGCEAYRVKVTGDGGVTWTGDAFVTALGTASATVDPTKARELLQRAADRGFWGLCDSYSRRGDGLQTIVTAISLQGRWKQVRDQGEAAPAWLRVLDSEIDEALDTHRWRHGEPGEEVFGSDHLVVDAVMPKQGVTRLMRVSTATDTKTLGEMVADTSLDLNASDSSGWTALMYAAQAGTLEALRVLLAVRADPARLSNEGESVMFAAVSAQDRPIEKIRMLRAAGVDINGRDHRGVTPLMLAARRFQIFGLVPAMIELSADPSKRDASGKTALDYLELAERENPSPWYSVVRPLLVVK